MLSTLINALKVKELRGKLLFTLIMFVIFRFGAHIPAPGINPDVLSSYFSQSMLRLL